MDAIFFTSYKMEYDTRNKWKDYPYYRPMSDIEVQYYSDSVNYKPFNYSLEQRNSFRKFAKCCYSNGMYYQKYKKFYLYPVW